MTRSTTERPVSWPGAAVALVPPVGSGPVLRWARASANPRRGPSPDAYAFDGIGSGGAIASPIGGPVLLVPPGPGVRHAGCVPRRGLRRGV